MANMAEALRALQAQMAEAGQRTQAAEARAAAAEQAAQASVQAAQAAVAQDRQPFNRGEQEIQIRDLRGVPTFEGAAKDWRDWSVILRSYARVLSPAMGDLMRTAEGGVHPVHVAALDENARRAANQLYFLLINACRGAALDAVINCGDSEGASA